MTRKEFERIRIEIESEKFHGDCTDPIEYGIERASFERQKFKRLIAAARQVPMQTARTKMEQWKRQLERATESQQRFQKIRDEIKKVRPAFFSGQRSVESDAASTEQAPTA
jgi:hypothetical protein